MTTRAQFFNLYVLARRDLTARQRLGLAPSWPDRPEWLRPDFDELDVAVLRESVRETWPDGAPSEGAWEAGDAPSEGAWDRVAADDDIDGILDWVDAKIDETVEMVAISVIAGLVTGGKA